MFDQIPIRYPRKGNLQCLPRKSARFALQDARLRICPDELKPWIADDRDSLDVAACYNGDDIDFFRYEYDGPGAATRRG